MDTYDKVNHIGSDPEGLDAVLDNHPNPEKIESLFIYEGKIDRPVSGLSRLKNLKVLELEEVEFHNFSHVQFYVFKNKFGNHNIKP